MWSLPDDDRMTFTTRHLRETGVVTAPDGSAVRPLAELPGVAGLAHVELAPGQVCRAVSHATVQEIWYVIGGSGRMWRRDTVQESTVDLVAGTCLTVPLGTMFQVRADVHTSLRMVALTVPPRPADGNAQGVAGRGRWPVA